MHTESRLHTKSVILSKVRRPPNAVEGPLCRCECRGPADIFTTDPSSEFTQPDVIHHPKHRKFCESHRKTNAINAHSSALLTTPPPFLSLVSWESFRTSLFHSHRWLFTGVNWI
jgi:hypothetical protein